MNATDNSLAIRRHQLEASTTDVESAGSISI